MRAHIKEHIKLWEMVRVHVSFVKRSCKNVQNTGPVEKGSTHTQTRGVPSSGDRAQVRSGWICNGKDSIVSELCKWER